VVTGIADATGTYARLHRCRYQGSEPSTGTTMIVCPNDSILVGAT
jgi:hypothetical protein